MRTERQARVTQFETVLHLWPAFPFILAYPSSSSSIQASLTGRGRLRLLFIRSLRISFHLANATAQLTHNRRALADKFEMHCNRNSPGRYRRDRQPSSESHVTVCHQWRARQGGGVGPGSMSSLVIAITASSAWLWAVMAITHCRRMIMSSCIVIPRKSTPVYNRPIMMTKKCPHLRSLLVIKSSSHCICNGIHPIIQVPMLPSPDQPTVERLKVNNLLHSTCAVMLVNVHCQ